MNRNHRTWPAMPGHRGRAFLTALLSLLASGTIGPPQAGAADAVAPGSPAASLDPHTIPGLISLWDFQEPAGSPRRDHGPHRYALQERNGPIARAYAWRPLEEQTGRPPAK